MPPIKRDNAAPIPALPPSPAAAEPAGSYRLEAQIGFLMRRAHQRHVAIFAECMDSSGLTPTQFAALAKIWEENEVSQNRLGRMTAMDPATILGVVQRLTRRGLVTRRPDPDDPRYTLLSLTGAGRALLEVALPRARDATTRTLDPLSEAEAATLVALLARLGDRAGR